MKLREWVRGLISPCPSLFDLAVGGILGITFIASDFLRGSYFIFYSIFLYCFAIALRPRRVFCLHSITLLLLWSFVGMFYRNTFNIVPNSIMNHYFNTMIMFEGFVYLLAGAMLITTIVRYSTNIRYS